MEEVVIVGAARSAIGRAKKGSLTRTRIDDVGAHVVKEALKRAGNVPVDQIEDVLIGCAMPEGETGLNRLDLVLLPVRDQSPARASY